MFRFTTLLGAVLAVGAVFPAGAQAPSQNLTKAIEATAFRPSLPGLEPEREVARPAAYVPETDPAAAMPQPQPALADRYAAMAPKLIAKVDVSDQTMRVIVEGREVHRWKVSTAGKGYRTPRGVWQPYRMHTMWYSRKYDNAPMPHSIFFTGGYAIHATPHIRRLGTPASHGCVRLHPDNAKALFALAKTYGRKGMRVVIEN